MLQAISWLTVSILCTNTQPLYFVIPSTNGYVSIQKFEAESNVN